MTSLWLYLHILLLVFWVGTDVGVFIAARWSERTALSIETRQTVLQLGMVLDRLPRSALTLIMPSGCQLANASGWLNLSDSVLGGMWAFAAIWLVILWRGFLSPDPTIQEQSAKINWGLNLILALGVSAVGIYLLTSTTTPSARIKLRPQLIFADCSWTVGPGERNPRHKITSQMAANAHMPPKTLSDRLSQPLAFAS